MVSPNAQIYKYEIPGGQYSNLLAQVTEMAPRTSSRRSRSSIARPTTCWATSSR